MRPKKSTAANEESRQAWNANAAFWDERMGEGNDFVHLLQWPAILRLLDPRPGQRILDAACGNGLTSRRLAALGAQVDAFDFSTEMIKGARTKPNPDSLITYHVLDGTDDRALVEAFAPSATSATFDSALCNMALFDMAEIEPLFRALARLIKPGGAFVFTIIHPAFNNPSTVKIGEEWDDGGVITRYSIKVARYMTDFTASGVAIRDQPKPQPYFHRPLQDYLQLGFRCGFVLDGFEERAFPPDGPQKSPLGWGGRFSEFPAVLVARLRILD
jgi:2-polyprenyl-3-methyl-5-hydroxy-6-metoxy-1,4-benzoquinol methylase